MMDDLAIASSLLRIVVAEDDPVSRLMLERWLKPHAGAVMTVEQPESAWQLLESEEANVLFTDLRFEGVESGLDLAERVRSWSPDFPIILVTAFGDQEALVRAIEIGVDHVLIKPVQRVLLRQVVQKVARQFLDRRALREAQAEIAEQQQRLAALRMYEQRISAHVQHDILYRSLPERHGPLHCTQRISSVDEVNGDFVDGFVSVDGALDILVGDAMGKGLSAAMLGAGLKTALMRLLIEVRRPLPIDEICSRLSAELQPALARLEGLITLQYWRIDARNGSLQFVDCGHTKAVLQRAGSGCCILLHGENLPLGVTHAERYVCCDAVLMRGDRLLLASDGIVDALEAADNGGAVELLALLDRAGNIASGELAERIMRETDAAAADDRSLLVLDWAPESGPVAHTFRIASITDELPGLREGVNRLLSEIASDEEDVWRAAVEIGLVEAVTNAFYHGGVDPVQGITVAIAWNDMLLTCEICYRGLPFRPERAAILPPDYSESGYGRYVIEHCFDKAHYFADRGGHQSQAFVKMRSRPSPACP